VSSHNNYVFFNTFSSLSATYNWFNVTNCQPHATSPVTDGSGFLVVAGRHDSSGPANAFKSGMTSNNMLVSVDWGATTPSNLNFAFSADIRASIIVRGTVNTTVSLVCNDVRIGQGSSGSTNNWWVGQPGAYRCSNSPDATAGIGLQCTDESGSNLSLYVFGLLPGQGDNADTFGVTTITAGQCF
jgi:hypothetical protein